MLNSLLFERSVGTLHPRDFARIQTDTLLRSFRSAPRFRFDCGDRPPARHRGDHAESESESLWAHQAGVTALALERFDGRILISGGADATIRLWDLEQCANPSNLSSSFFKYTPLSTIQRAESSSSSPSPAAAHRFGITHLSFYPFDPSAFLSSSFDQTLKLWSTATARVSGTFALNAKVYTHAVSPAADHLLVACGTQHPAVRLVDLRSAAAVQSLVAPSASASSPPGATLAVSWSPSQPHALASAAVDGAVRIWDVRRSNGLVALLDQEDGLGIFHPGRNPPASMGGGGDANRGGGIIRASAKAHHGPANGLVWTDDGAFLVSTGHDRRVRVWDAATGRNTLVNFGPSIRNSHVGSIPMVVVPATLARDDRVLVFPNETEILLLRMGDGKVVSRLRGPGTGTGMAAFAAGARGGRQSVRNRVTSVVWRGAGGGGQSCNGPVMGGSNAPGGLYSGHMDGQIRAWMPRTEGADDEDEDAEDVAEERSRKRKALDEAYRSLMGRQVTFGQ
ncbi:hypothetical protein QBC47DRAFT_353110 [Echria macrotheca]|uniref:DNA excision repair protein ERCC-8 n=1 Tax=Echria macrotheca TaxID=438768 RepID=A0AAJ0B2N4_9PEZI|nr:hypothetical protein QBC47DRAFT_353110 [Echria macrotheca]